MIRFASLPLACLWSREPSSSSQTFPTLSKRCRFGRSVHRAPLIKWSPPVAKTHRNGEPPLRPATKIRNRNPICNRLRIGARQDSHPPRTTIQMFAKSPCNQVASACPATSVLRRTPAFQAAALKRSRLRPVRNPFPRRTRSPRHPRPQFRRLDRR